MWCDNAPTTGMSNPRNAETIRSQIGRLIHQSRQNEGRASQVLHELIKKPPIKRLPRPTTIQQPHTAHGHLIESELFKRAKIDRVNHFSHVVPIGNGFDTSVVVHVPVVRFGPDDRVVVTRTCRRPMGTDSSRQSTVDSARQTPQT
jgi:hypothetical protein